MNRRVASLAVLVAALAGFVALSGAARAEGDAANGAKLMAGKCAICHNWQAGGPNRIGPNLFGVVGRTAGQVEGFNYTAGMKKLGVTWSAETLAAYLAGPAKMVPGTKMTFPGFSEPKQAADVIAYLATLH